MNVPEAFAGLRAALESAEVRYAVGGSWASTAFGEPRFTYDVDILAEFDGACLEKFLKGLPSDYYVERDEALDALSRGRPFNIISMQTGMKFDLFPARAYPLGREELNRAIFLTGSGLAGGPIPFVTPEDILLCKLHWYSLGGGVLEVQWRDVKGLVRTRAASFYIGYLESGAATLGVADLVRRALEEK